MPVREGPAQPAPPPKDETPPPYPAEKARGGQIVNENDPSLVAHSIRIGAELGADVIKVPYSGHQQSFARAVAACPAPVVIGGGPRNGEFKHFLRTVREVLDAGAAGVCIGRNIFQQDNPAKALEEVCSLVHGG